MEREVQMTCTPSRESIPLLQEEMVLYLLVEVFPASAEDSPSRLPLDICLVLDVSSSMRGERLFHAKEATRYMVNQLQARDNFSLIAFNDRAEIVVPRQPVRAAAAVREHVLDIEASGGTEMARGLEYALSQMRQFGSFSGVRRVILMTDGQTYGDEDRCVELARQIQGLGIGLTTLGLGDEWNEDLLATISAHGSGRSEYMAGPEDIVPLFQEEMRLLQGIVAQEMALSMMPEVGVQVRNIFRVAPDVAPVEARENWEKEQIVALGEWMGADPQVFLAELVLSPLSAGEQRLLQVALSYFLPRERARRKIRYELSLPVAPGVQGADTIPVKVRRGLEKVMAYRLQESAWKEAKSGNIQQATRRLEAAATRLVELGEMQLAQVVEEEARRLNRTGRTSAAGKKEIQYGTRRLGRRWFGWRRKDRS
jgi:Ca-activated chloride channel family protein